MRIVSQNGMESFNIDNLELTIDKFLSGKYAIMCYASDHTHNTLGIYQSLERAKEVFAEIHCRYADVKRNELVLRSESDLMINYCAPDILDNYLEKTKWSYLYQLPKE